jgi:ketosteroid isomerase-like protein
LATRVGCSERVVRKAEKGGQLRRETLELLAEALATADEPLTAADLTTDPLAVAQAFMRVYLRHGIDAPRVGRHLLAPDLVVVIHAQEVGFAGTFVGVDGFERMIRAGYAEFEVVGEEFGRWYSAGQRVAVTQSQRIRPRAAPQAEFTTWITHEYEVAGGRIVRIDTFTDSLAYARYRLFQPAGHRADAAAG